MAVQVSNPGSFVLEHNALLELAHTRYNVLTGGSLLGFLSCLFIKMLLLLTVKRK